MPSPNSPNEYPLDISPPDVTGWAEGNTGIPYVWSFAASDPGPHVMLTAVVHGNELCGALALDWLLSERIRPSRGTLSFGFMNVAAFNSYDPKNPNASRFVDEDFNRLWADEVLASSRDSVEMTRALEVRPIIHEVDFLLDIHSMQHPAIPLMMAGPANKGRDLAKAVGTPQTVITDFGHPQQGRRMRDYAPFIDPASERNSLLVECGQHWAKSSEDLAKECAVRFLRATGAVGEDCLPESGRAALPVNDCFEVTDVLVIKTDNFRFAGDFRGGEILSEEGSLLGYDGDQEIRTAYPNCMLVMPTKRLAIGQTAVRLARRIR